MLDDGMELTVDERRLVAEALLDSVAEGEDGGPHPAWREEILRRIEQVERGEVQPEPWSQVRAQMRRAIGR